METNLTALIQTLATGGAAALIAVLFSWLAEQWPAFGAQSAASKLVEQVAASAALGLGAWYLVTYQPALLVTLQPVFGALVLAIAPVLANQLWHRKIN